MNMAYLNLGQLTTEILGRGFTWLDTGTHDALIDAGQFVLSLEQRMGLKIACLEEIAFQQGWLSHNDLLQQAEKYKNNLYGEYLLKVAGSYKWTW